MPKTAPSRVRIGEFELNLDTGELSGKSQTVQLGEKPLRILVTLIENRGQLVTRDELQRRLWPNDTVVDFEHGINTAIKLLRKALGDSADAPRYVETVPRRGYRLMVPVEWINESIDREAPGADADAKPRVVRSGGMTGKVVSHYRVLDLIGGGGMGVVYRAEDLKLGRIVALKFLSEELGDDPEALERFHREARAISILDHPNICPIYEFGEHAGLPFLVMPLLQGRILRDRLAESVAKGEAFPLEELLNIGLDISAGLQAAHEKGIIHRDIKPANVFLTDHGHAKILDFGVAKVAQTPATPLPAAEIPAEPLAGNGSDLTSPRSCLGTYPYMSPEQAAGKELDARTDLFSFGVVLCEMATGSLAFSGGESAGVFKAIAEGKQVRLNLANSDTTPELERIIWKALEKDCALRYQTAAEMRADLSRLKRDSGRQALELGPASASQRPLIRKPLLRVLLPAVVVLFLAAGALFFRDRRSVPPMGSSWVKLTDFPDGATQPALSPDGRMLAFIRGPETFVTPGQIYVKMLPNGEPVQLTRDASPKMAPVFSPDGSRITYTAMDGFGWNTWVVPILGGEPTELLPNAAALTWADAQQVVFSEIKTGVHMGIETAQESRRGERDVYLPANTAGMAHRSWVSPDGKWMLVSEMDLVGWLPCRVLPFDGSSSGQTVGPKASRCTYAGWSPDGKTMYFSADAGNGYHIWRQRFPNGAPEQLTFGPTEEEGIAVSPDGRSLVTSAGIRESTVWVHDVRGDRQVSGEGLASVPGLGFGGWGNHSVFSLDGKVLFYLVQKKGSRAWNSGELWRTFLDSGRSEAVLPGVPMSGFDLAPDGHRVAFEAVDAEGNSHVFLASLDHSAPPRQLDASGAREAFFGPDGAIYFLVRIGNVSFVYGLGPEETTPKKLSTEPVSDLGGISPRGDMWILDFIPVIAPTTQGASPIRVCSFCGSAWGPGGKYFYVRFRDAGEMGGGKTIAIALPEGKELPNIPPSGFKSVEDVKGVDVVAEIDMKDKTVFAPGPSPSVYAYVKATVQRNLFRIPLD
jgi:serine/threonine protein kinase/Tol biopolymer transport system component